MPTNNHWAPARNRTPKREVPPLTKIYVVTRTGRRTILSTQHVFRIVFRNERTSRSPLANPPRFDARISSRSTLNLAPTAWLDSSVRPTRNRRSFFPVLTDKESRGDVRGSFRETLGSRARSRVLKLNDNSVWRCAALLLKTPMILLVDNGPPRLLLDNTARG